MTGAGVTPEPALTPGQCRAARGLLGWNGLDLTEAAGVEPVALARFESMGRRRRPWLRLPIDLAALRRALESAGVEFIPGGARLREEPPGEEEILPGTQGRMS